MPMVQLTTIDDVTMKYITIETRIQIKYNYYTKIESMKPGSTIQTSAPKEESGAETVGANLSLWNLTILPQHPGPSNEATI